MQRIADDSMTKSDIFESITKSKTQIKREMLELRQLAESIVNLSPGHLDTIPLDKQLLDAIHEARRLKQREARRRQIRYISKMMRSMEIANIQAAYQKLQADSEAARKEQHFLEMWREKLIAGDDATIQKALKNFPDADRQHLRNLVREAKKEVDRQQPPANSRKLFRYLRDQYIRRNFDG
jgi:ribosome-associated protein